jgi:RNA polymerase sigma factor (sigma-70 family)
MADTPSYEQKTEMEYDALIKTALGNEKKNFFRDMERQMKKQALFSELDDNQVECFEDSGALEAFNFVDAEFQVLRYSVAVRDALLHDALSRIDEMARNVILMAFWLEMSDREIADDTGIPRRTVNKIRNKAYMKLKEILEGEGYDANSFFPKHDS